MISSWMFLFSVVAAVIVTGVVTAYYVREKDRRKLEYMLDAFEDGELNFRFQETSRFNRTLNRIKWIAERRRQQHEEDSWTKLIRVLTHEIMNTVSPIASLSEALSRSVDAQSSDQESSDSPGHMDVKAGLETIAASSHDLIRFVESYRELAGVARPVLKALMLDPLVHRVIELTSGQCADFGASCSYEASTDDMLIYADETQISRILINLIKNALQAGATHIRITARMDEHEHTLIDVANDGAPITPESQEQIFIPFFTTKPGGSGIGLSLSRQIMRAHNGMLDLVCSDDSETRFRLTFR